MKQKTYAKDPRVQKNSSLKLNFGITIEQYDLMLAQQHGVCAVCQSPPIKQALSVDHCHTTKIVRGLLCQPCNLALGMLKEDPLRIRALEVYINNFAWLK